MFQLQDLVSTNVTQALALQLTGEEKQRLQRRYTDNAAAYQAYLRTLSHAAIHAGRQQGSGCRVAGSLAP
ncbi:MAG: hypothetical protein U0Y68_19755 [Blastocatellia bacterium]